MSVQLVLPFSLFLLSPTLGSSCPVSSTMSVQLALPFSLLFFLPLLASSCPVTLITCGGGSLINITWPFTTDPYSKCRGGYLIHCNGSTPMIKFDVNGLQYVVEDIQGNILTIRDPTLSKLLQGSHCSFLYEFTEPYPRLDHAHSIPYLASKHGTFFNCSPRDYDFSRDIFDGLNNITPCEGYNLHYLYRLESQPVDSTLPQGCESSPPPYFEWRLSFEEGSGELSLKSAGFSQQLGLYKDCFHCHIVSGRCNNDTVVGDDGCRCSKSCSAAQNVTRSIVKKIVIGVGVGGGILVMCFICCIWYYRRRIMQQPSSSSKFLIRTGSCNADQEMCSNSYRTHVFSYSELHEATNGFDESRELGDGGFGTVYKGQLRDGRVVAVKRLYENNYKRVEQFLNEVDILSRLRHKNLVTLYGCTSRHSRELLLVYEFVANGTVADHLHGPRAPENGLTWGARLNIAIETADALAYLHAIEPQIIHRDVKTNNILLDNSFHVKVADFGLSRLFPVDATHVSTLPQGTPGYVDPEYHQCYQLTDKSDVYSFGVVLVELISSMPAVDISRHRHEINLANLAVTKIQNREIEQLVDPRLAYREDWEIEKMINMVAELAFRCLQGDRDMRPTIKEVLAELKQIENKGEKVVELGEIGDDARLLKSEVPYSPDTVTVRWDSKRTTPNTSA